MRPHEAGRQAREQVAVPWDEVRAARVQRRVLDELGRSAKPVPKRVHPSLWVAAAALLVWVSVFGLLSGWLRPASRVEFADGSVVVLGIGARVVPLSVGTDRIEVEQTAGQARYEVTSRPGRAFIVRAGDVIVQVIGTVFTVEQRDAEVRIRVVRGRVKVTQPEREVILMAGDDVTLRRDPSRSAAAAVSTSSVAVAPSSPAAEPPGASFGDADAGAARDDAGPPASESSEPPSAAALFRIADVQRGQGNAQAAIQTLRELIRLHPTDGRVALALFTIGRLEAQRGQHAEAARAFEACGAAFSGEAWAEAALAWAAAGQAADARANADKYLAQFPNGPRRAELTKLAP